MTMYLMCVYLITFALCCQLFVFSTLINFSGWKTWNPTTEKPKSGTYRQDGSQCKCRGKSECSKPSYNGTPSIDIRIVTKPLGQSCSSGMVYCCYSEEKRCGKKTIIAVNGISLKQGQAQFGEYPWQAIILNIDNDYVGSGALIDNLHVLTVAHKISQYQKSELIIRLGDWDLQSDVEPYEPVDVRVAYILRHPDYNNKTLWYDIAILTLDQAVRTYPHIQPVCLPSAEASFTGSRCWVSGWGKDMYGQNGKYQNIQKHVDLTIHSDTKCESQLRDTRLGPNFQLHKQSFICAGGENGKDACTGDGGSPLVCERNGQWYLVGLVAWGIGCAQYDVPGVYVDIISLISWVNQCTR